MRVAGARGITRSRIPLIAMLALAATAGLAGCEGDNGEDTTGPTGPTGPVGPTGPTGPTVPPTVPIEDGGPVTIGNGSTLTTEQIEAIGGLVATLDSAAITDNKAVIQFTVKTSHGGPVLGLAATTLRLGVAKLVPSGGGLPSRWQSYINRNATPSNTATGFVPALASAIQANTESGTAAGWQEVGNGVYRYNSATNLATVTSPIAVAYEPALTHRVSIAIDLSGAAARALAPDNPFRDFVPAGGSVTSNKLIADTRNCAACHVRFAEHGGPRRTNEYCVVCHNPASVDPDGGESVDFAYMAHSIHRGENRDQAYRVWGFNGIEYDFGDVTYPQSTLFCENCHTKSAAAPQGDDWLSNPSAAVCGGCHDAGLGKSGPAAATGRYTYTYEHTFAVLAGTVFDDGTCGGCHRDQGAAGSILESHRRGDRLSVELGRAYTYKILSTTGTAAGQKPTVKFQVLKDGQPVDVKALTTGRLRIDFAWSTDDIHNVADLTTGAEVYAQDEGGALVVEIVRDGPTANMAFVTANGDGTFTYASPTALPAGVNGDMMVVLEGRRAENGEQVWPSSATFFPGKARASLVEQSRCENCHEFLVAHGGSRAGDPNVCVICHNSSAGFAEEGIGPLAFGAWMHNLHDGNLGDITFPQESTARCETCHKPGTYSAAREKALPISTAAGADARAVGDDTWDSATAGTCRGCHESGAALAHMTQNGGVIGRVGGKKLVPSTATESCVVCHGPDRSVDTARVHCEAVSVGTCAD